MVDHDELVLTSDDPDPALLDLTDQITERLLTGDPVNLAEYANRYPQWAGTIRRLLPTMCDLVNFGRAVDRDRRRGRQPIGRKGANDPKP